MTKAVAATLLTFALLAACGGSTNHDSKDGAPTAGEANAGTSDGGGAAGTATAGTPGGGSASAGTHSGGAPHAGTPSGGMPSAGTSGGGDSASAAGSGADEPECNQDEDCRLVDDCCRCDVVPVGAKDPGCAADCNQGQCEARGYAEPKTVCLGHRCIFDVSCKSEEVTCKLAKPTCPPGLVPGVVDSCWGPCLRPEQCSRLSDCTSCSADQVCIADQDGGLGGFRCVRVAPDCAAHPTCECTNSCFAQCSDTDGISCFCIAC